jgi:hypothetical protein
MNQFIVTLPRKFGKARLEAAILYFIHGDGPYGSAARHFTIKKVNSRPEKTGTNGTKIKKG